MSKLTVGAVISAGFVAFACSSGPAQKPAPSSGQTAPTTVVTTKPAEAPKRDNAKAPDGEDVLAKVNELNSDKWGPPPVKFKKGHVTRKKSPKVKKTKLGYEIRFASSARVATPAVYRGKVYVSGGFQSKEFHAFHATTGKSAWSVGLDDDGPSSSACDEGICVFNTESCTVFALDANTGKQKWSWWLGDPQTSSPTIANGIVFTSYPSHRTANGKPKPPTASHVLAAFDLKTGKILWQKWLEADVMSAPVAMNEFVYISTFSGLVAKLEQKTGKFRYAIQAKATSAPVVHFLADGVESMYYTRRGEKEDDGAEEMIIRADHNDPKTKYKAAKKKAKYIDKKVQATSAHDEAGEADDSANGFGGGAPAAANAQAARGMIGKSSVSTIQAFQGSRVLHFGAVNVNTMGDEVLATDSETGSSLWAFKLTGNLASAGGSLGTAPLAAGQSVVVATLSGEVLRMNPTSGKIESRYKVGRPIRSQPVVSDGWIYVGTEDGRLVAINTKDKSLTGWPMWGGDAGHTGLAKK